MEPKKLIKHAVIAQKNSQAKYSNFSVGSALLTANDEQVETCRN